MATMKRLFWAAALCALPLFAELNAQNLLQNGSFAQEMKGWEVMAANPKNASETTPATLVASSDYKAYGLAENHAGISFVELTPVAAVQQRVETQKDGMYILAFGYAHRPNAGDKQLLVTINGETVFTQTIKNSSEAGRFVHKHLRFKANGESAKIAFYMVPLTGDDKKGLLLSDVLCNLESEVDLNLYYSY